MGKKKEKIPKVLVCRLVTDRKAYCVKELIDTSLGFTYPNVDVYHFDNSPKMYLKDTLQDMGLNVIKTEHFKKDINGKVLLDEDKKPIEIPIREMMVRDMNLARDILLKQGYDYMLILESDIIPHEDIIEQLMSFNKDICAAFYWLDMKFGTIKGRDCWYTPVNYYVYKRTKTGKIIPNIVFQPDPKLLYYPSGLIEYAHAGFGCTLVSRKVFEKVSFRYDPNEIGQVDAHFHRDAIKHGFIPYVHTGIIVGHQHEDWDPAYKV